MASWPLTALTVNVPVLTVLIVGSSTTRALPAIAGGGVARVYTPRRYPA